MDVVTIFHEHGVGKKVVLYAGIDLNNVAALPTNIQIVNMDTFQIRWPGAYCECVGPKKSKLMMTPDVDY